VASLEVHDLPQVKSLVPISGATEVPRREGCENRW